MVEVGEVDCVKSTSHISPHLYSSRLRLHVRHSTQVVGWPSTKVPDRLAGYANMVRCGCGSMYSSRPGDVVRRPASEKLSWYDLVPDMWMEVLA